MTDPRTLQNDRWARELERRCVGGPLVVERLSSEWRFHLGGSFLLHVRCLWRLLDAKGIAVASEDDGHQFGLPAPIDAQEKSNRLLHGATVTNAAMDRRTSDLRFHLSNGLVLELVTTSAGYESWQAYDGPTTGDLFAVGANGGIV